MILKYETEILGLEVNVEAKFVGSWLPATMTEQEQIPHIEWMEVTTAHGEVLEIDGLYQEQGEVLVPLADIVETEAYENLCEQEGR